MPTEETEIPPAEAPQGDIPLTEPAQAAAGPAPPMPPPGGGMPAPMAGLAPAPSDAAMFPPAAVKTASAEDDGHAQLLRHIQQLNRYG